MKDTYYEISENNIVRRAQIPIRRQRFQELTNPTDDGSRWDIVRMSDHFLVFDKTTRFCYFDATYMWIENKSSEDEDNPIVAVISKIKINNDYDQCPDMEDNDFGMFCRIVLGE